MPKILDDRVEAMKRRGMPEDKAYAIATSSLQREGKIKKGSRKLTDKGRKASMKFHY